MHADGDSVFYLRIHTIATGKSSKRSPQRNLGCGQVAGAGLDTCEESMRPVFGHAPAYEVMQDLSVRRVGNSIRVVPETFLNHGSWIGPDIGSDHYPLVVHIRLDE